MAPFRRLELVTRHATRYLLALRLVHAGTERCVRELVGVPVEAFKGPVLVTITALHRTLVKTEFFCETCVSGIKVTWHFTYRCFLDFPLEVVARYLALLRVARVDLSDFILVTIRQVHYGSLTAGLLFDTNELRNLFALTARSLLGNTSDSGSYRSENKRNDQ